MSICFAIMTRRPTDIAGFSSNSLWSRLKRVIEFSRSRGREYSPSILGGAARTSLIPLATLSPFYHFSFPTGFLPVFSWRGGYPDLFPASLSHFLLLRTLRSAFLGLSLLASPLFFPNPCEDGAVSFSNWSSFLSRPFFCILISGAMNPPMFFSVSLIEVTRKIRASEFLASPAPLLTTFFLSTAYGRSLIPLVCFFSLPRLH